MRYIKSAPYQNIPLISSHLTYFQAIKILNSILHVNNVLAIVHMPITVVPFAFGRIFISRDCIKSRHELKRQGFENLQEYFYMRYGSPNSKMYRRAVRSFISSLVGFLLLSSIFHLEVSITDYLVLDLIFFYRCRLNVGYGESFFY